VSRDDDLLQPAINALRTLLPGAGDHDRVYRALCRAVVGLPVEWAAFSAEDWQLLLDMAKSQRVVVRTQRALQSVDAVPPVVRQGLRASAQMLAAANLALRSEFTRRILPALRAADCEPLLLKGLAMALAWYDNPQDRQMDDIDLLVAADRQPAAVAALRELGYEEQLDPDAANAHHVALSGRGPIKLIEVHRTLGGHRTVSEEAVLDWYLARTMRRDGGGAVGLQLQDAASAFLFQTAHLLLQHGEGESRINWYLDLHLIVESGSIAWPDVLQRAEELGWSAVVLQALRGIAARFGTRLDPALLAQLAQARPADERLQTLLQRKQQPLDSVLRFDLRRLKNRSWPQRLQLAWSLAVPPADYMRQRYGLQHNGQLPAAYLQRWGLALTELRNLLLKRRGRRRTH
jgi:hypothetical protein